jgi:hypothetical protein
LAWITHVLRGGFPSDCTTSLLDGLPSRVRQGNLPVAHATTDP